MKTESAPRPVERGMVERMVEDGAGCSQAEGPLKVVDSRHRALNTHPLIPPQQPLCSPQVLSRKALYAQVKVAQLAAVRLSVVDAGRALVAVVIVNLSVQRQRVRVQLRDLGLPDPLALVVRLDDLRRGCRIVSTSAGSVGSRGRHFADKDSPAHAGSWMRGGPERV